MTISLTIKVSDGLVFAADSAVTMTNSTNNVTNIYNNGNKLFNLYKGLPIGAATWGGGNIGRETMEIIIKDFRKKIMSDDPTYHIDKENYTIKDIADKLFAFLNAKNSTSYTGFYIGGYSSNEDFPETWQIGIGPSPLAAVIVKDKDQFGTNWQGNTEVINRIIFGFPLSIEDIMSHVGIGRTEIDEVMKLAWSIYPSQLVTSLVPIQDAIDIAEYLVQTTIKYVQYSPGDLTVGGPIDIASITKNEGFKWIKRKYYFDSNINPKEG